MNNFYSNSLLDNSSPLPAGAPEWITAELIVDTISTWQPYYDGQLTSEDALEILLGVGRLMDILEQTDAEAVPSARPRVIS